MNSHSMLEGQNQKLLLNHKKKIKHSCLLIRNLDFDNISILDIE